MPTYTYQCKVCGHKHDVFHAMSAKPRVKCSECKGACIRLIGKGAGVIFKGSGFYETDYKKGKGKGEAKTGKESAGESKSESKAEDKKEGKSETKSEAKSEAKTATKSSTAKKE